MFPWNYIDFQIVLMLFSIFQDCILILLVMRIPTSQSSLSPIPRWGYEYYQLAFVSIEAKSSLVVPTGIE